MNSKLPNPDLNYESPIELDFEEASLALHALRAYIHMKGNEVSDNTKNLESKLQTYIDRRLGGDKIRIEIDDR